MIGVALDSLPELQLNIRLGTPSCLHLFRGVGAERRCLLNSCMAFCPGAARDGHGLDPPPEDIAFQLKLRSTLVIELPHPGTTAGAANSPEQTGASEARRSI
jgi:hypothetical protein